MHAFLCKHDGPVRLGCEKVLFNANLSDLSKTSCTRQALPVHLENARHQNSKLKLQKRNELL